MVPALSLLAAGCSVNPATGKSELIVLSQEQEIAMGVNAAPEFEKQFNGKVPDAALQQYVAAVGAKIAQVSDRQGLPYEYTLLTSDVPNAFALPGGKIFVTAGLMSKMTNERQLAAVLGHETGHVAALHNVKGIQKQIGVSVLAELAGMVAGDKGQAAKAATKVVGAVANLKYSRGNEYQADMLGVRYMARAGYNPWGMVELLETLFSLNEKEGGTLTEMFQTHPLTSKRIAEAKEIVQREHPQASPSVPDPNAERFLRARSRLAAATRR